MGIVLTVLIVTVAVVFLKPLLRLLVELFVRFALGLLLAVSLGIATGVASASNGLDGLLVGIIFALAALVPCIAFVWYWRAAKQARKTAVKGLGIKLPTALPSQPVEERLGLNDMAALQGAWEDAMRLSPDTRLDASREACARFLKAAASEPLPDAATTELAVLIRKHLPGLVADTRAVLEFADQIEAKQVIGSMLDELQAFGDEATEALAAMQRQAQDQLSIRKGRLLQRRIEQRKF